MDLAEFEGYLAINKNDLDTELQHQAELMYKVGEAYVDAVATRDACKEQLAGVDAALDVQIRNDGVDEKLTEPQIKAAIQAHPKHKKAHAIYAEAKADADKLGVLKDSMHQRGYMLRDLCQLYIANYYEESSVKSTNRTDSAIREQRAARAINARRPA